MTPACLTEEQALELVAYGDLEAHAPGVSDHLDACDACRALVSALATLREEDTPGRTRLVPGATVGRFVLRRRLGEGGMGVVWEADDPRLGRAVALKCMHPALATDVTADRERTLREARAVASLNHPNVVTVFDAIEHEDAVFIAFELVPGGTLSAWLREGTHRTKEILEAFAQAGRGLAAAHRAGIVHGDFKPDNVLRSAEGTFKVTDFGLARGVSEVGASGARPVRASAASALGGTAFFMAPERLAGGEASARADEYSFAIAVAAALGVVRGPGEIARRARGVPSSVLAALARAASPDPRARFETLDELIATLETASARRAASRRLAIAIGVAGVAVGLGAAAWALVPEPYLRPSHMENGGIEAGGAKPDVWTLEGSGARDADLVRTTAVAHSGRASAQLRAHGSRTSNYVTAMEMIAGHDYRGHRVRAAVWIRTKGCTERADFWIRARYHSPSGDGPELGATDVALAPTSDWKRYELELDVPIATRIVDFGVGFDGPGTLWFDDASLEIVK
jgi:hypothetical protein